ncbi:uncharacterized protein KZ484_004325 [Pholidichthys leucotaenia]
MAKRRSDDALLHESPSKRCFRPVCGVNVRLESIASHVGGVSPPSLLDVLGSRSRKRPYYFEDREKTEEVHLYFMSTHRDSRKHSAGVVSVEASGSFREPQSSCTADSTQKRPREESAGLDHSDTVITKAADEADATTEDCAYNSFQYWRVPLPELDLSLLEDSDDHSKETSKERDPFSHAMET